ncbi:MAG: threonine-phosphate decarboxylase [Lachnospiraceae bacterium]|jgi:threonine-phosphate decarboxylase|uniref:threonine-phosphate decarboxylase CobD n=1 Tax=Candidatus Merdisoma sp. JLR.KK006 TaxID=3112626 RepID=UPI002FF30E6B|nr:threonine-phosphate decarboxylase [Lachnospiraceae bacterium]
MEAVQDLQIQRTIHGGDRYGAALHSAYTQEELLDFSANINPLGMPGSVGKAVLNSLSASLHYPDPFCRQLRSAIAENEGAAPQEILCGNGGADLIYRLVYALRPKQALVTAPAFAEYEEALGQVGAEVLHHNLPESMELGEALLESVTEDLDLIFICNPNNPTGLLAKRDLLLKLLEKAENFNIWVCIDECFLDFVRDKEAYTLTGFLSDYPHLVILKSFTKLYAMPGLRLGCVLSKSQELLEKMRQAGQPWSVSEPAMQAGMAALKETGYREQTITLVEKERQFLMTGLTKLGCKVWPGKANYLCFRRTGESQLYEKLLNHGILIRRCENYHNLTEEDYRVAVRTHEENERLLQAIKEVLAKSA